MNQTNIRYTTIDEYIASFPKNIQIILEQIRHIVTEEAPEAKESISYGMPAFKMKGHLVYFAAFKDHIGFYPTSSVVENAIPEAAQYRTGKGTLQFPLDKPMPFDLIRKIVIYRVKEDTQKKSY